MINCKQIYGKIENYFDYLGSSDEVEKRRKFCEKSKILGQYQDYFLKHIAMSFFKIYFEMYLNFYQKKIGLKAQTPTNESTKQEIFCNSLVFVSYSSSTLFWLKFSGKIIALICWTNPTLQTLNQRCPDSDERGHKTGDFFANPWFFSTT
jgi:hypothetical protein